MLMLLSLLFAFWFDDALGKLLQFCMTGTTSTGTCNNYFFLVPSLDTEVFFQWCLHSAAPNNLTLRRCSQSRHRCKGSQQNSLLIPVRPESVSPCRHRSSASTLLWRYSSHFVCRCCMTKRKSTWNRISLWLFMVYIVQCFGNLVNTVKQSCNMKVI